MSILNRRLLITGITGFLGKCVYRYWRENHPEVEIWGTSDRECPAGLSPLRYRQLDLRDLRSVREFITESRPTDVVHLASLIADAELADFLAVNVVGSANLYTALAEIESSTRPRVVQTSSASVYGTVSSDDLPIVEEQASSPVSAYAISKACQEYVATAVYKTHGLPVVRARIFNMLGPDQPDTLMPMAFVKQVRTYQAGLIDHLEVGNTASCRDFVDVRDVAIAIDMLLDRGRPGEAYNVGSGQGVSIKNLIDLLLQISGTKAEVVSVDERFRRTDVQYVRADVSKICKEVGWRAAIPLRDSLEAMMVSRSQPHCDLSKV